MKMCMQSAAVALVMMAGAPAPGWAQDLPAWKIADICAKEPAQCATFEARARQAVTGGWGVLPEAYRMACLGEVKSPIDQSWRLLSQCLEQQVLQGLGKRAVLTVASPPEPGPPPVVSADGVPAPPFGLPTSPPKAD